MVSMQFYNNLQRFIDLLCTYYLRLQLKFRCITYTQTSICFRKILTLLFISSKSTNMQRLGWCERFVFYGVCGFAAEVLFTSVWEAVENGNRKMHGVTSAYTYFIYGISILVQEQIFQCTKERFSLLLRGLIYLVWSMAWECCVGLFLKLWNACPWDYAAFFRCHFMGVITAEYIPLWYIACLFSERFLICKALQLCWYPTQKMGSLIEVNEKSN